MNPQQIAASAEQIIAGYQHELATMTTRALVAEAAAAAALVELEQLRPLVAASDVPPAGAE